MLMSPSDVLAADFIWNDRADTAADMGRLRQSDYVINSGRNLLEVRRDW